MVVVGMHFCGGGMCGCRGGVCGCGGHAWLQGACMVVGGMCGCRGACVVAGGCAWLQGVCVVAGGHAWLQRRRVCVVAGRVHGGGGGVRGMRQDTVNERIERINECILVCIAIVKSSV